MAPGKAMRRPGLTIPSHIRPPPTSPNRQPDDHSPSLSAILSAVGLAEAEASATADPGGEGRPARRSFSGGGGEGGRWPFLPPRAQSLKPRAFPHLPPASCLLYPSRRHLEEPQCPSPIVGGKSMNSRKPGPDYRLPLDGQNLCSGTKFDVGP
jgi:hypothetical protein